MTTTAALHLPKILIVEDEQIVAADLEQSLRELGYGIAGIADSGQDAIQMAANVKPDLVLMDIYLHGALNGVTAAEQISGMWHIPCVFVTANTNDELLLRARAVGPYGYLIKPFRVQELNATIMVALRRHQLAREVFSKYEWLQTILASVNDGVIAAESCGRIRYMNPMAEYLTDWSLREALGKDVDEVFTLSSLAGQPVQTCLLKRAAAAKRPLARERFLLQRKDGSRIPIEDSASPIIEDGVATGAVSVFLDVTDRLRREREAEELKGRLEEQVQQTAAALGDTRAELRALSGHLMTAQEEERRRLARELHDDFSQRTAIIEMQAARALDVVPDENSELKKLIQSMREQISLLEQGLRTMSHRLHPTIITHLGLVSALRSLVDDYRAGGREVSARLPDAWPEMSPDISISLYRITQEALRNAMKHAPGAPVRVTLDATPRNFQLTIEDAGPGFNLERARVGRGLGLLSMQERARLAGGTLLINTEPGEGTTLTVRILREAVNGNV